MEKETSLTKEKFQIKCIFYKKGYCKSKDCVVDCDFRTLKFDKISILHRIEEEKINIRKLVENVSNFKSLKSMVMRGQVPEFGEGLKQKIMDKTMGIYKMKEILDAEFSVVNEYKDNLLLLRKSIMFGK